MESERRSDFLNCRNFCAELAATPDQVEGMLRLKMLWPDDESALPVGQKPMIMPTR